MALGSSYCAVVFDNKLGETTVLVRVVRRSPITFFKHSLRQATTTWRENASTHNSRAANEERAHQRAGRRLRTGALSKNRPAPRLSCTMLFLRHRALSREKNDPPWDHEQPYTHLCTLSRHLVVLNCCTVFMVSKGWSTVLTQAAASPLASPFFRPSIAFFHLSPCCCCGGGGGVDDDARACCGAPPPPPPPRVSSVADLCLASLNPNAATVDEARRPSCRLVDDRASSGEERFLHCLSKLTCLPCTCWHCGCATAAPDTAAASGTSS